MNREYSDFILLQVLNEHINAFVVKTYIRRSTLSRLSAPDCQPYTVLILALMSFPKNNNFFFQSFIVPVHECLRSQGSISVRYFTKLVYMQVFTHVI